MYSVSSPIVRWLQQQIRFFEIGVVYQVVEYIHISSSTVFTLPTLQRQYTQKDWSANSAQEEIRLASRIGFKKIATWISWIFYSSFCQRQQRYVIASSVGLYEHDFLSKPRACIF